MGTIKEKTKYISGLDRDHYGRCLLYRMRLKVRIAVLKTDSGHSSIHLLFMVTL